jgi:hypothetical protein
MGAETRLMNEVDIPKEVMDIAKKTFLTLNMNFGCVDIVEYKENKKTNYLVMEVNTEVLTDLFDHFEDEELVKLIEKSIDMRSYQLKYSKDIGKVNFADLKVIKPEEKNILSTYNERASAKRKSVEDSCKKNGFPVKFYSQDYLSVINDNIFMIEFDIGLNKSTAISICSDKGVTTKVLSSAGIPSVEHQMFSTLSEDDTMENIIKKAKEWDMNVVVKKR